MVLYRSCLTAASVLSCKAGVIISISQHLGEGESLAFGPTEQRQVPNQSLHQSEAHQVSLGLGFVLRTVWAGSSFEATSFPTPRGGKGQEDDGG